MLLLVVATAMAVGAAEPTPRPRLCVSVESWPEAAGASLEVDDLIEALRARIARSELRIVPCRSGKKRRPQSSIEIRQTGDRSWVLRMVTQTGASEPPHVGPSRDVHVRPGMQPFEVAQRIAIDAAELARPAVDELLARFANDDPVAQQVEALERQGAAGEGSTGAPDDPNRVRAQSESSPVTGDTARGPSVAALLGLGVVASKGEFFPHIDVALSHRGDVAGGSVRLGGHPRATTRGNDYTVDRYVGELGLGGELSRSKVEMAASAQVRATALRFRGAANDTGRQWRAIWTLGVGLEVRAFPVDLLGWRTGPILRLSLWPRPARVLVRGEAVAEEEYLEVTLTWALASPVPGSDV